MIKTLFKKVVAVLISAMIILTGMMVLTLSTSAEETDWTGYVPISTKAELDAVRNDLAGKYYLTGDMVFTVADFGAGGEYYNDGHSWDPIGTNDAAAFTGVFDGNGHTISGLTGSAGLFGYCKGTIKNLGFINGNVKVTTTTVDAYAGGIADYNYGAISNCYNLGGVSATTTTDGCSAYAGGIVGYNYGTISSCFNAGNVNAIPTKSDGYAGGIAGYSNYASTITNCYNTGSVTVSLTSSSYFSYAGGIEGGGGSISNCYNTGNVTAASHYSYAYAGGISGTTGSAISNCYNTASVTATSFLSSACAGGIVGYNYYETMSNCYNIGAVNINSPLSNSYAGGISGYSYYGTLQNCYYSDNISKGVGSGTGTTTKCTLEQMKQQSTFAGFNFSTIWVLSSQDAYLFPTLQQVPHVVWDEKVKEFITLEVQQKTNCIGSSIRTNGVQGIRVKTSVNKSFISTSYLDYQLIEYGMLAIKNEYLGGSELTVDGIYNWNGIQKPAVCGVAYQLSSNRDVFFSETVNEKIITCVLINITEANYLTDYSVRAYYKFQNAEGKMVTVYGNEVTVSDNAIATLAYQAKGNSYTDIDGNRWAESYETRNYLYHNILIKSGYSGSPPAAWAL